MVYCIGVTGGIGSGKSSAANLFAELGAAVVDTDEIARHLTARDGDAVGTIAKAFGDAVIAPDGSLNRAAMRELVFADTGRRRQLEAILHPMIRAEARRRVLSATTPYVLLLVPLLLENKSYTSIVQRVLVVDCDEAAQIERTVRRSQLSEESVRAIMAAQLPREKRVEQADDVIDNNGDLEQLRSQVTALHQRYLELAEAHRRQE
ncbi:MAG: dephospho-CoA kinase [Betaproteobacteria bacterium]|jgi:dephospho-CoA kinase|nr:dephospho-CoA kinase [Betaproteobacteria bacterium]